MFLILGLGGIIPFVALPLFITIALIAALITIVKINKEKNE